MVNLSLPSFVNYFSSVYKFFLLLFILVHSSIFCFSHCVKLDVPLEKWEIDFINNRDLESATKIGLYASDESGEKELNLHILEVSPLTGKDVFERIINKNSSMLMNERQVLQYDSLQRKALIGTKEGRPTMYIRCLEQGDSSWIICGIGNMIQTFYHENGSHQLLISSQKISIDAANLDIFSFGPKESYGELEFFIPIHWRHIAFGKEKNTKNVQILQKWRTKPGEIQLTLYFVQKTALKKDLSANEVLEWFVLSREKSVAFNSGMTRSGLFYRYVNFEILESDLQMRTAYAIPAADGIYVFLFKFSEPSYEFMPWMNEFISHVALKENK